MMTYLKRYIALLLLCGTLTQCQLLGFKLTDKPETLPPITQEGKNTFGCYINGNLFLPRKTTILGQITRANYSNNVISMSIKSYKDSANNQIFENIGFFVPNIRKEGSYKLEAYPHKNEIDSNEVWLSPIFYLKGIDGLPNSYCEFNRNNHNIEGIIVISKINEIVGNFFISGTFEFTLTMRKAGSCDVNVLRVTQGRFDLKIN